MAQFTKIAPFSPGPTKTLAITGTTANTAITGAELYHSMIIYNAGAADVFVELGGSNAVTASATTSMPIRTGTSRLVIASPYVAGITATGTSTLWVTLGDGGAGPAA